MSVTTVIKKSSSGTITEVNGIVTITEVDLSTDPQFNGMTVSQSWKINCTDNEDNNELTEFVGPGVKK